MYFYLEYKFTAQNINLQCVCLNNIPNIQISFLDIIKSLVTLGYPNRIALARTLGNVYTFKFLRVPYILSIFDTLNNNLRVKDFVNKLEPSEKASLSYELGMIFAHLLSERFLNTPYTVHLNFLEKITQLNGSMPDLIAYNHENESYYIIEAKGSLNKFNKNRFNRALEQVLNLEQVNNMQPAGRYVSYFTLDTNNLVKLYFVDPDNSKGKLKISLSDEELILLHYRSIISELIIWEKEKKLKELKLERMIFKGVEIGDLFVGIYKEFFEKLKSAFQEYQEQHSGFDAKPNISKEVFLKK